jgi:hypothetical protein
MKYNPKFYKKVQLPKNEFKTIKGAYKHKQTNQNIQRLKKNVVDKKGAIHTITIYKVVNVRKSKKQKL